jgi:hypothetical protein
MLLVKEFGSLEAIEKKISFLSIDTDTGFSSRYDPKYYMGTDISLRENEKYHIRVNDSDKRLLKERGYHKMLPPLAPDIDKNDFAKGAGGNRSFGRLAFFFHAAGIKRKLDEVISKIRAGVDDFNVIILTSFLGGTGSGTFIDACYLAGHCIKSEQFNPILYAVIGFPVDGKNDIGDYRKVNVFSALTELEFYNITGNFFDADYDGLRIESKTQPAKFTYLINHKNKDGKLLCDIKTTKGTEIYKKIAEHIFYTHIFKESADIIRGLRVDYRGMLFDSPTGLSQKYLTFGISSLEIPVENIYDAYIRRIAAEIIKEGLSKAEKEPFAVKEIIEDIRKQMTIQSPEERFKAIFKFLEEEEKKDREKKHVRADIDRHLQELIDELQDKYGSEIKENPEYAEINRRNIKQTDIISTIYSERVEGFVNRFFKDDKFKTGLYFLETVTEEVDKAVRDFEELCRRYTKDRNQLYKDIVNKVRVIRDEINLPLADVKWHIGELKKIIDRYYKVSSDLIQYTITVELTKKIKERVEDKMKEIETKIFPMLMEEGEKLLRKYNDVQKDIIEVYGIDIDNNFTSEFKDKLHERVSLAFDISGSHVDDAIEHVLKDQSIKADAISRIREIFSIDRYVKDLQKTHNKNIKEIISFHEKDASLLLELTGVDSKSEAERDPEKDSLRFCFTPKGELKVKDNMMEFEKNIKDKFTAPNRIIFVKEESSFPLKCLSFFDEYKGCYDKEYGRAHTVRDKYDKYIDIKIKTSESKSVQPLSTAKKEKLNEFQLVHIGQALGIAKVDKDGAIQAIYDEVGKEILMFDELELPLPEHEKFERLHERVLSEISKKFDTVKEKIKEYMLSNKTNTELYTKLYKELIDNFIKKY